MKNHSLKFLTLFSFIIFFSDSKAAIISAQLEIELFDDFFNSNPLVNTDDTNLLSNTNLIVDNSPKSSFAFEIGVPASDLIQSPIGASKILFADFHDNNKFSINGNQSVVGYESVTVRATGLMFDTTEVITGITIDSLGLIQTTDTPPTPIDITPTITILNGGTGFEIVYTGNDTSTNDFSFSDTFEIQFGAVPEPSSSLLFGIGLIFLLGKRKRI